MPEQHASCHALNWQQSQTKAYLAVGQVKSPTNSIHACRSTSKKQPHRETCAINGNASSHFCSGKLVVRELYEDRGKFVLAVNSSYLALALNYACSRHPSQSFGLKHGRHCSMVVTVESISRKVRRRTRPVNKDCVRRVLLLRSRFGSLCCIRRPPS